jgi:hypothetical protein
LEALSKRSVCRPPRRRSGSRGRYAWPDVSTRVLSGRADRLFPADFQVRAARERLGGTPMLLPGGYLVALSRPEELAVLVTGAT